MDTRILPFSAETIADAAALITSGQPVGVPTETVYGLAGDATSDLAVAAIYEAKGRPSFNPLIVHLPDLYAGTLFGVFNQAARTLAETHWPGPLTLVVPLRSDAPIAKLATAGLNSIAIRVPAHRAMQALMAATGKPLAAPSANASGTISPTTAAHVMRSLDGRIPMVIDDGPTPAGVESTIIACTDGTARLLRPGPISLDTLAIVQGGPIEAPGQMAAHYAPSKPLRLNAIQAEPDEWLIGFGAIAGHDTLSAQGDLTEAASRLFAALHDADTNVMAKIAVAPVPETGLGVAINDRLRRAAIGTQ